MGMRRVVGLIKELYLVWKLNMIGFEYDVVTVWLYVSP
jgi:hypothetical protein